MAQSTLDATEQLDAKPGGNSSAPPDPYPRMWLVGVVVIMLFWLVDAAVDSTIFEPEKTFLQALLRPEPVELWMRSVSSLLIFVFGLYAGNAVSTQRRHQQQLRTQRSDLEDEIKRRTELEAELRELANTDPLTSVYNRRRFYEFLQHEL